MQRLEQPFRLYTDAIGKPLDAGFVYFGVAGQSPDTSPITVYWDDAGTIPAAQPLRTVAGYIVRNGAPANVYYSGTYSELVKDKNGVQVFVELSQNSNPAGFLTALTRSQVITALGYTPVSTSVNEGSATGRFIVYSASTATFRSELSDTLEVQGGGGGAAALMQYHRPAQYIIKEGIDYANNFFIGGGSQGNDVYRVALDTSGNLTALGNVTAYSDMRRKTDITALANTTERLLQMRGFTYLDTVTGQRKIGVGAQEVQQAGYGEAVVSDEQGTLSVAYGQLALPLLIEFAREMQARVTALETKLQQLKEF